MMFLSPRRELESGFLPRDGQGTLRRAERGGAGDGLFFFSEGGIQSSVLYSGCCAIFWNGTLVCLEI